MIYSYRCTECQLLRCAEDGKVCDECMSNMANTIEAEDAPTGGGLRKAMREALRKSIEQMKVVDIGNIEAVDPKPYDPGFFRYNTNWVSFNAFVHGEVIPKIQQHHNVVVKRYTIGPANFDIDLDLNEWIPYDANAQLIIRDLEAKVVADLNQAFNDWTMNGRKLPW